MFFKRKRVNAIIKNLTKTSDQLREMVNDMHEEAEAQYRKEEELTRKAQAEGEKGDEAMAEAARAGQVANNIDDLLEA